MLYNADCIKAISEHVEPESVQAGVCDPPFAIDFPGRHFTYHRNRDMVIKDYNEITAEQYPYFTREWLRAVVPTLTKTGTLWVVSGWSHLKDVLVALDEVKMEVINHIIWQYNFPVFTRNRFVSTHLHVLYCCHLGLDQRRKRRFYHRVPFDPDGRQTARYRDLWDVWVIKKEYWRGKKKTQNKLPTKLVQKMLDYSTKPGDLVLDPFAGSGQVGVTAIQMGRQYVGFEIKRANFEFALSRMEG